MFLEFAALSDVSRSVALTYDDNFFEADVLYRRSALIEAQV